MVSLELDIQMKTTKNRVYFTVQIVTQRLRGSRANFIATNGFKLMSLSCPAIGVGYNIPEDIGKNGIMYLRGSARDTDERALEVESIGYIERLKQAVIEYNIAKECVS